MNNHAGSKSLSVFKGRLPLSVWFVLLALAFLPLFPISNYVLHVSILIFIYVALGLGLNIVVGLAGLLDLGYIAFYAVGAYTYAVLTSHYNLPFIVALFLGALLAAIIGLLLGWPTIRARGDYLALITLGFGEIIRLLMRNWDSLTNGPRGVMNVSPPRLLNLTFLTLPHYYYLGLILGFTAVFIFWSVKHSAVGRQLAAVGDDEEAAAAIGINPVRWKLYAFTIGALLAGLAGVFFASWQRFVSPESFTLNESILVLSIVVLGGMGTFWTTIIAASFLVALPEALRGFQNQRGLILGMLLVIVVILQEKLRLRRSNQKYRAAQEPGILSPEAEIQSEGPSRILPDIYPDEAAHYSNNEVILSLDNVSKKFDGVVALDHVSLQARRGEIIGLVGANGAGKTTLLGCIAGAVELDSGSIKLCNGNTKIDGLPVHKVAQKGVVRTFQHARPFNSSTAADNIQLGRSCRNTPAFWEPFWRDKNLEVNDTTEALLCAMGIQSPLMGPEGMGFVDRKLVEFARTLLTEANVLLIDEPAAGMDENARSRLAKIILEVSFRWKVTVIVIEHDLNFLYSLCQRIIVMERGIKIADGKPEDSEVRQAIQRTYYGE